MAGSSRGNKLRRLKKDATVCLSDLPDAILIHILSFLPTKSVVSTSLLSRRWRYLWVSTPNLVLNEYQFKNDHIKFKYDHDKLMNFAERALVLRAGTSLVSFSLSCWVENDESRINTLITFVIQHNVEQLSLNLSGYRDSFFLPFCIFSCQSLVKLDLSMRSIRLPSMICLPRLKHLSLGGVKFADNESTEKMLSHPLLEQLILRDCTWYSVTTVHVNSPKLQSFSIENWLDDDSSEERQVCFFGDNLKFFSYEGSLLPIQYCICGSTMQLMEAVILVECLDYEVLDMDGPSNRYYKLLNSLSGVQNLTLSEDFVESLYLLSQCQWLQTTLPEFGRLTQLNLKSDYDERKLSIDSKCLTMLYQRCPHLEHLNFMVEIELDTPAPVLSPMPSCFRTHLKKVTLQSYEPESDGDDDERDYQDAINVLFNSAPVLEEVVIHLKRGGCISSRVSRAEELERKLNARPKVSGKCRVSVV